MSMSVRLTAGRKVLRRLENGDKLIRRGVRKGWFAIGKDWKAEANKEILRKPKSGRTYIVRGPSGRRRRHVASAPGETHANLRGNLRKALSWRAKGHEQLEVGYGLANKPAPDYAAAIEFGKTNRPNTIAERRSVRNAIEKTERNAEQHLLDAVTREIDP